MGHLRAGKCLADTVIPILLVDNRRYDRRLRPRRRGALGTQGRALPNGSLQGKTRPAPRRRDDMAPAGADSISGICV